MTHPIQMYYSGAATADAAAAVFTPVKAKISAILLTVLPIQTISADAQFEMELSFQSVTQRTVNDAVGVLASLPICYTLQTSGTAQVSETLLINNVDIVWEQGQRIYLHMYNPQTNNAQMRAIIYANW